MQIPDEGRCPHCDCGGEVGHGCATELCQRKGYHYIPLESYQTLTANEHRNRNPSIGTVIGRYLLVSELGHGGFGTVYLALQLPIKMKAALKLVHRADSPEQAAERERRFLGEAQSLARLNHPNIVRMLQYDSIDDQPYLVMEYVPGRCSLDQEIARRRLAGTRFSTAEIERIASQVAAALDSAHGEGVIHRDLKPENLMLQEVSGDPLFVRILDFGLAKLVADPKLSTQVVGTPAYMAPEQLSYEPVGPWTDFYALGVICVLLLTGRSPFPAPSTEQILAMKLSQTYDPLSALAELLIPDDTRRFIATALCADRQQRYGDGAAFMAGLRPALSAWAARNAPLEPYPSEATAVDSGQLTSRPGERQAEPETSKSPVTVEARKPGTASPGLQRADTTAAPSASVPSLTRDPGSKGAGIESSDRSRAATGSAIAQASVAPAAGRRFSGRVLVVVVVAFTVGFGAFMFSWPYLKIGVDAPPPPRKLGSERPLAPSPGGSFLGHAVLLGGTGEDRIFDLARDAKGRVIAVGSTSSRGAGQNDGWIVAFDAKGTKLWEHTFGGGRDDELTSVTIAKNGDILAAGYRASTSDQKERAWLLRLGSEGQLRWERLYEGEQNGRVHRIVEAKDGGVVAVGYTRSKSAAWLFKTDANGRQLFQKTFRGKGSTVFADVVETADRDLVVVGFQRTGTARYRDLWVMRLEATGAMRWQKFFGAGWKNKGAGVALLADGSFAVVGYTQRPGSKRKEIWVLRLSASGALIWQQSFSAGNEAHGNRIVALSDDSVGVVGTIEARGGWILKLAILDGRVLWQKQLAVANGEAWAVIEGASRQLWIGGALKARGRLDTDAFVIRLSVNGDWVGR